MSVYARLRVFLALFVAIIGASVWLVAGQQREAVVNMQGELRASSDLLTAMLDQETGLRGYAQTGREVFLEPYRHGRTEFDRAITEASADPDRDVVGEALLRDLTATARLWQGRAAPAVERIRQRGRGLLRVSDVLERKQIMDRFRRQNARFRTRVEQRSQHRLDRARWTALVFVFAFGVVVLGSGLIAVERTARRDAQRRMRRTEFVEALQGADDELEAKELLRRQAERVAPGAQAVVLTRNASDNSLEATTDPSAVVGLADALIDATPRSCLAIRRGRIHETGPGTEPLQSCELCYRVQGASLCVPSLVGGEVIGSLLAIKPSAVKPAEREAIAGAAGVAAPVLANLRNLALAEHRAATDPLTRLPNARTVQETLIRMVAQAQRTGSPLSAVVVDLDHFKALNDRHGHQAGDEVLQAIGATLRRGVRASDFAGRWGGEEFLLLLPDTDSDGALLAAENMRALLDGVPVPAVAAHVTASLGVATLPDHAADGSSLVRAADRALYAAKAAGRNCVVTATAPAPITV